MLNMSNSCVICPQCRNKKGEVVDSNLFKNLMEYSSHDRSFSKKMYALSMDKTFLSSYGDRLEFDENNEPTLKSLLAVSKTTIESNKVIDMLNKQLVAGVYSWNEAVHRVQQFNASNNGWNTDYMATAHRTNKGYEIEVVKRTAVNEGRLAEVIKNKTLKDRLLEVLAKHGVAVDFLQDGKSKYSTENAEKMADGMYHLIQIANGEHVEADLAEEAGHFAVAALNNSPLVERLLKLLTPEVQREALGDAEFDSKYMGKNARREVAGDLVGKALSNNINEKTSWGSLAKKIADLAKRVFYAIKKDDVMLAKMQAEQLADKIARNFLSNKSEASVDTALSIKETLFSTKLSQNVQTYKKVLDELKTAVSNLKAMNSSLGGQLEWIAFEIQKNANVIEQNIDTFSDLAALEAIATAADRIIDIMNKDVPALLKSVDFSDELDFDTNLRRNGHSLREAHTMFKTALHLVKALDEALATDPTTGSPKLVGNLTNIQIQDSLGTVTRNLKDLHKKLVQYVNEGVDGQYSALRTKEKQFFLKFLENSYGSKYVYRAARVLFNGRKAVAKRLKFWQKSKADGNQQDGRLLRFVGAEEVPLEHYLDCLEQDTSFFDKWLGSMANSGDIIGGIVDKVTKQANKQADDLANATIDELRALEQRMYAVGVRDSKIFYERDHEGNLTGNFISQKLWGVWENNYNDCMREAKEKFLKDHKDDTSFEQLPEIAKVLEWQKYWEPIRKKWHRENSFYDSVTKSWQPSDAKYHNYEYDKLTKEQQEWLIEMRQIKRKLDGLVGNAMPELRAPQFKGTTLERIKNGKGLSQKAGNIWEDVTENFLVDVDDAGEFGSELTYNEEKDDMFGSSVTDDVEKCNRLPLFGINKLKNMSALSTDIFAALASYASMAAHYAAMNQVVDTLEVGREVLSKRKRKGKGTERWAWLDETEHYDGHSRAFTRYSKFLDKQVYGIGCKPIIVRGLNITKMLMKLSTLASKMWLGGNVHGGLVNVGTGEIEIMKEAISGEFFSYADFDWARRQYFKYIPVQLWNIGSMHRDDKLSLVMRHFNFLNDNKREQRDYQRKGKNLETARLRTARFLSQDLLMAPYSAGDHYMQSMAYMSLMHKQKVIGLDGSTKRLWDAYEAQDIHYTGFHSIHADEKEYGKTLGMDQPYFKTEADLEEYKMVQSILDAINSAPALGVFGPNITLTDEQKKYLDEKGWSLADLSRTVRLLQKREFDVQWNVDDESALMDKAREINDRMHGIYNDQDKTAFHQILFGNMLLAMRGYALGMVQRRFGNAKYSVALGGETEGSMLTLAKVIASIGTEQMGLWKAVRAMAFPIFLGKGTKEMMLKAGFSSNQFANMRRTQMDFLVIGLLTLLKMLTAKPDDDDDKAEKYAEERKAYYEMLKAHGAPDEYIKVLKANDKKRMEEAKSIDPVGITYYFATRWLREQAAFNTGPGLYEEAPAVTSLVPAGISALSNLAELTTLMFGDMLYDYEEYDPAIEETWKKAGFTKEQIKILKEAEKKRIEEQPGKNYFYQKKTGSAKKGEAKWISKLLGITPYYKSNKVWYNPYDAAKSFEYGRQVRVK